ncbi:MAG: V-type ATP synthase subunit A [Clostridia bacterium]|nr:V-type ATP synthase subunit A [Clostridia bacterium]MBQ6558294.1 V-type ATP synthase subunit A [Clostridia bacterium]MBQ9598204.1 V-type ATP synthase subunit A [Clostridia bacterium]
MAIANGTILGINGPVVRVIGSGSFEMQEMVYVGDEELIGEVIGVTEKETIVQVYEETTGLKKGEKVTGTGSPLAITLAPGILSNIFDGIERPLKDIKKLSGAFVTRGLKVTNLDEEKEWDVKIKASAGDVVSGGDIIATTQETSLIEHRVMIPPEIKGTIEWIASDGKYKITDVIAKVKCGNEIKDITIAQKWPIKKSRPYTVRQPISRPLVTGQRVIDAFFPLAKGGAAAIPGGFGTGKTMTQHQLAKWCDADIIVYIGCGERGNEMTQVLEEFSELIDPKSGKPLLDRTVLIANTSNMPVAAREASIYTGVTLAEYYRDMGYDVALMADSTSRWAEALREISGRLEEMPAEEGFPAYLASRLSQFYERAGYVTNLNGSEGSVSIIGAVSPQGGDFSEPVTQNTKRFIRCFWALDKPLAYARHYPAIHWLTSYSEYLGELADWYNTNVSSDFMKKREKLMAILQEESGLMEIVKLIGADVLPDGQKATLEVARTIRVGFLQQNAFHADDTYVPLEKQNRMMDIILLFDKRIKECVEKGVVLSKVSESGIAEDIIRIKYTIGNENIDEPFAALTKKINDTFDSIIG